MTPEFQRARIKVSDMVWSPRNARGKSSRARIAELADLIYHYGVLNEPLVTPRVIESEGSRRTVYETDAGERRRLAMQLLVKQHRWPLDAEVDVKISTSCPAAEVSLVEHYAVEPMHPVDQFLAFQRLVDVEGLGVEDLAARFRLSPVTVRQRLRLSRVAPGLLDAYRDGDLSLQQLMALAVCEDHVMQEEVWASSYGWQREPRHLRAALTAGKVNTVNDPVARFVGLADYQAAGGLVEMDLFSEEHGAFVDRVLLDKLALRKLAHHAEAVRAEGWKWVDVRLRFRPDELAEYARCPVQVRDYTSEEIQVRTHLTARAEELSRELDRLFIEDGERVVSMNASSVDLLESGLEAAKSALRVIEHQRSVFSESSKLSAGAVVTIEAGDAGGQPRVSVVRGLIRRSDRPSPIAVQGSVATAAAS